MADEIPAFDPSKPFETVSEAPPFDPSKPYQTVGNFFDMPEADRKVSRLIPNVNRIMKGLSAFGEGFSEGLRPESLGLSEDSRKWLADRNVLPKDSSDYSNPMKPFMAFNEGIILPLAVGIDTIVRSPMALYRGLQSLGVSRGLPGDIVSIPDAFMGSPHPMGVPRVLLEPPKPFVKPVEIAPIEGSPNPGVLRSVAARTGDPLIDQILDHPTLKTVIDNPVVDDTHTIPNSLGGSEPVNNPTLYRDKDFPKTMTVDGVTFDTADPSAVHENIEEFVIDALVKGGMDQATALKVAFWNFGEVAEDAWYRAHGMDPEHVEAQYTDILNRIAARKADDVPADLFKGTYPDGDPAKAGPGPIDKPTPEESARGRQMLEKYLAGEGNPSGIVAFHGSPHTFEKFDISKIGTGEGAQAYGHGLYFAENEGVAGSYKDNIRNYGGQEEATAAQFMKAHNDDRQAAIQALRDQAEWVRRQQRYSSEHAAHDLSRSAELLEKGWEPPKGNMYQVSINADPEHFLDWDKPLSEQPDIVEKLKQGGIAHDANQTGADLVNSLPIEMDPAEASRFMQEAGIPGIKYLDQGSRDVGTGTRNYVVFDDNLVQITHVNGQPILDAARDLGVIGPSKVPLTEGKPAEAAARVIGGDGGGTKPPQGGGGGEPQQPTGNPWRDRFEHFVGKLETPDDVKQLIRESADEKGEFPAARQGDIPLAHVEAIAEAAGVEPGEINQRGLGRQLKNDAEVRTAMQLMLQVTENVKTAAREVRADGSESNLIKLQEAIMRRDLAVEQVVGLRAEWGRTGNVFQEFLRDVKDQEGLSNFLKDKGRSPKDLKDIADAVDALDRNQAARVLNDLRSPTAWDKFMWYWVNALISGPVTHSKYIIANAVFAGYESAVVTPIAGVIGALRQALRRPPPKSGGVAILYKGELLKGIPGETHLDLLERHGIDLEDMQFPRDNVDLFHLPSGEIVNRNEMATRGLAESGEDLRDFGLRPNANQTATDFNKRFERVYIGEGAARLWGIVAGTPDAIVAAAKAARTGLQTPLPGEIAQNIFPKQNKSLPQQQRPIEGTVGTLIGLPSRGASAIHSFFNFLGYRASIEAQAYRAAAKEGLSPTEQAFWEHRQNAADAPTKEMMDNAIEEGYRLTYINELSPELRGLTAAARKFKALQMIMPFMHIPFNILSRGMEAQGPAGFLLKGTREDLFGKNGAVKQDMAIARLVAGSAVGVWAVNQVMNDRMTGYGPTDPKERAQWLATGHQPYSIRIGDEWYSYNRFGPLGTMLGLHANLAEAIPHLKPDSEELTKALVMTVHSTGRLLEDEVGMQGLAGLIDAINDPERKGTRFVSAFAGSLLPYSSALRQTASAMDPYMRETKSFVDGLRYYIPVVRQDLLPKRDWLGEPFTNAGYGGDLPIPGVSSIIQHRPAEANPIAEEMKRLDLHPAVPQNRVGGVQLPPKLYDQYQMAAGQLKRQVLYNWVSQPNWYNMPEFARTEIFRRSITAANQQAGAMMMGMYPQIIQQGVQQRVDQINGVKPTKLKD